MREVTIYSVHIFINDIYVHLVKPGEGETLDNSDFNFIIDCEKDKISKAGLIHHVWIKNTLPDDFDVLLKQLDNLMTRALLSIKVTTNEYEAVRARFKSHFKVIKASGGVVKKGKKLLMIHRRGKWDLPKGKIDKGEIPKEAAIREVKEECGIDVKTKGKICNTWHTYTMKKRAILKKTTWYNMNLVDDSQMTPQTDEDIDQLRWMTPKEVHHSLDHSYRSIRFVVDVYYRKSKGAIIG